MIVVNRANSSVKITGHAGFAEPGKDIVCAAVSTLAQTLAVSLEKLTLDSVGHDVEPGHMEIYHGTLSDGGKYLIESFFIGVKMVAEQYPDYVKVMERSKNEIC